MHPCVEKALALTTFGTRCDSAHYEKFCYLGSIKIKGFNARISNKAGRGSRSY